MIFFAFFFFNDTATTEIYTLSLHDALPICISEFIDPLGRTYAATRLETEASVADRLRTSDVIPLYVRDRKSTRLNSSHSQISYAVFCLKKKKKQRNEHWTRLAMRRI